MSSHLPPGKLAQSRTPSLQRVVLRAFLGTTDPSDSLSALPDFSFRLIRAAFARRELPSRASPVPRPSVPAQRPARGVWNRGARPLRSPPEEQRGAEAVQPR